MSPPAENQPDRVGVDLGRIARLRDFLAGVQRLAYDYTQDDPTWAGLPGSMTGDEATDPTASPGLLHELNGAYAFAQVRMQAVLEYGESMAVLCGEDCGPSGSLGIEVMTRAAVETASRAYWVLEDGLSSERRTARFLAIEVHSANHLDQLAVAMQLPARDPKDMPTQMVAVKQRCSNAGLRVTNETTDRSNVGGERLPKPTDLVLTLVEDTPFAIEDKGIYELGSGVAHGASYALLRSYAIATGDQPSDRRLVSRHPVDQRIVESSIAMLLFAVVALLRRLVVVTGWDPATLDQFEQNLLFFLDGGPLVIS